jgi:tRNA (mo5U34)-methyltransferase
VGIDFQQSHMEDAALIKAVYGLDNCEFIQADIATLDTSTIEPADVVTMLGLLYNLEDPIGVLRRARRLTKKVLIVETQTTGLELSGRVDSGCHLWGNEMQGIFGIFPGYSGRDGAATDIILYPSPKGLQWILTRIGFSRVEILPPPEGAYEQLATGKRIMVAAYV